MNIKLGALIVGGLAAYAYYKYNKMSPKERKDIVENLKQKGKKIYDEYIPAVKETIEKNYMQALLNKKIIMSNILYIIAVILVIIWAIGFFGYAAGGLIHILLVIAVISIILQVIRGRSVQ